MESASPGTLKDAASAAATRLAKAGVPDPLAEAELLLGRLLGLDRGGVIARSRRALAGGDAARYDAMVRRRCEREPFQYIVGEQEFYGRSFVVDRRVLVPRPETEGLVEAALSLALPRGGRVADLGTGSGCIAVTLAAERSDLRVFALDCSGAAIEVARENARRHAVAGRIAFVEADMADPPAGWTGKMDLVVSNPPYVSEGEWSGLQPEVRDHEPRDALVPGPDGSEAYAAMAPAVAGLLRPAGYALLELGMGRREAAVMALEGAGMQVLEVRPDIQGVPRVLVARRPASAPDGPAAREGGG